FIPFVTEEIWHKLPGTKGSVMTARIPGTDPEYQEIQLDAEAESQMELIMGVVTAVRNIRGEMNISPSALLSVLVQSDNKDVRNTVDRHRDIIAALARLEQLKTEKTGEKPGGTATSIVGDAIVSVYLEGVIDFSKEIERLEKEIAKIDKELAGLSKKLANSGFLSKAPESVVEKVRSQYNESVEKIEKLKANRERIKSMESVQT
ncbi:MAG: class I tRNA ligase family protein, partial [Desulfosalsimonas sp.]